MRHLLLLFFFTLSVPTQALAKPKVTKKVKKPSESSEESAAAAVEVAKPIAPPPPPPVVMAPRAEVTPVISENITLTITDKTSRGAMVALAHAMIARFEKDHGQDPFHRVAVPYFKDASPNAQKEQAGKLLAELLSVELAQQKKFVIVERERLDALMREHRMADLGVVDEGTAAAFGKVLGAQSLVLGTVTEAGPDYVVTVRQVDAETGAALVSGQASVERIGLIALSSEAIETRSRGGAILRSAIVPGWGQIYNKEPVKGALFASGAAAALGTAAGFFVASNFARNAYNTNAASAVAQREIGNRYILVANVSLVVLAGVWLIGVVDAAINGRDYSRISVTSESGAGVRF